MIDNGKSMRTICEELSLKRSTITRWLSKEYEEDYQNAKQERAECLADKLMEEATVELKGDSSDNARVRAARLQVDTLKWITGKLYPAQYGVLGPNRRKSALVSVDTRCCSEFVGG